MADEGKVWEALAYDASGLSGKLARITVDIPRDSGLVPSDLPDGVKEVVIVDDTPDVTADLAVHPVGQPDKIAIVHYNDLAVEADQA